VACIAVLTFPPTCLVPAITGDSSLTLTDEGLRVVYNGRVGSENRGGGMGPVGTLYGDHPVPASTPLYYYEVTIVDAGSDAAIGVGMAEAGVRTSSRVHPGWVRGSYGIHGDDGAKVCRGRRPGRLRI
jgi:hypothetical protein